MFKDKTKQNQLIEDLNFEQDKREARILWIKQELVRLTDETNRLIAEATQDYLNLDSELRRPLVREMQELESQRPR